MLVAPAPGRSIRDPVSLALLPAGGEDVSPTDLFWSAALAARDVVLLPGAITAVSTPIPGAASPPVLTGYDGVDLTGVAFPGAAVTVTSNGAHLDATVAATPNGSFVLSVAALPAGTHDLVITALSGGGKGSQAFTVVVPAATAPTTKPSTDPLLAELQSAVRGISAPAKADVIVNNRPLRLAFGFKGRQGKIVAGLDRALRWIASGGFAMPAGAAMEMGEGQSIQARSTNFVWGVSGLFGKMAVGLKRDLSFHVQRLVPHLDVQFGTGRIQNRRTDWPFAIAGASGGVLFGVRDGDAHLARVGPSARLEMLFRDNRGLGRSQAIRRSHNLLLSQADYQLVLVCGQSLSAALAATPALSTTARPDCWMVGGSVRPQDAYQPRWLPIADATLHPLVATVESNTDNVADPRMTPSQVAATDPLGMLGESPGVALTNHIARAYAAAGRPPRNWVCMSTGVSGRSVADLSPGATPNLFKRVQDALDAFKAAVPAGKTAGVAAIVWMQGEQDYTLGTSRAAYLAGVQAYRAAVNGEIAARLGQAAPPPFLTYQTSGSFVIDSGQMSVGLAQLDFAQGTEGVFMVGPAYEVTDEPEYTGHLDANGSRWFGALAGAVAERVVVEREAWEPVAPLWIDVRGRKVFVGLHVPAPPLAFDLPWVVEGLSYAYPDKGFRVEDSAGFATILSVDLLGGTTIEITCDRQIDAATGFVWAGDRSTHLGGVLVRDSAGDRSDDLYTFQSPMAASANIPALVGKPYPLHNWLVAFRLPIGFAR